MKTLGCTGPDCNAMTRNEQKEEKMQTHEIRNPDNRSESVYVTGMGHIAISFASAVRREPHMADTLRQRLIAQDSDQLDADKQFAFAMVGINAEEQRDKSIYDPMGLRADWTLAQGVIELEQEWGLRPIRPVTPPQDAECRHGRAFSGACDDCDADQ